MKRDETSIGSFQWQDRRHTECSSCLTSMTEPSLKVHLTMSVSSEAALTYSEALRADQNLEKSWILIRCQTCERGARMMADSLTEVEVGMADILKVFLCGLVRASVGMCCWFWRNKDVQSGFVQAFGAGSATSLPPRGAASRGINRVGSCQISQLFVAITY
jgi:hypothetical protein